MDRVSWLSGRYCRVPVERGWWRNLLKTVKYGSDLNAKNVRLTFSSPQWKLLYKKLLIISKKRHPLFYTRRSWMLLSNLKVSTRRQHRQSCSWFSVVSQLHNSSWCFEAAFVIQSEWLAKGAFQEYSPISSETKWGFSILWTYDSHLKQKSRCQAQDWHISTF